MSVSRLDRDTQNTQELWKFLKCHNPFETEAVLMNIVNCVAPWYQAVNVENAQIPSIGEKIWDSRERVRETVKLLINLMRMTIINPTLI
jgi:hypothetical protein